MIALLLVVIALQTLALIVSLRKWRTLHELATVIQLLVLDIEKYTREIRLRVVERKDA